MMFSMNTVLALICTAFIPVIVLYSLFFYRRISSQFLKADEAEGELMSGIQENLTAVRVVRAFGREKFEKERFEKKLDLFTQKWIDMGYTLGFFWGVGDFVTAAQILAIVCAGAWLAATGQISLGELLAFISYTYAISWPVRTLGRTLSELSKAGVSITRLREILDVPVETDAPGAKKPALYGDICFERVSFKYGEATVLDNLSFRIPQGSTFGILGATGSGKSTIAYLLNRLYELAEGGGKICIGGVDIRGLDRFYLRREIGLILQEPFLFSKTARENIEITAGQANLELVRKSAKIAAVDDNIMEFKDGYDTMIGERGVTLSGGQKQRIAIARALMRECPIMIFDDSMSSVDMETDEKIRLALRENIAGKTVILISHRISTLMQADKILVLENGRAAQMGAHAQLLAEDGVYRRVYKMQSDALLLKGYREGGGRVG
jgi:ATP-binding cassette subfamily B protein